MSTRHEDYAIGIDVGGTRVRAAVVDAHGDVMSRQRCGTSFPSFDEFVADLAGMVRALLDECGKPNTARPRVGLAIAGVLDGRRQIVRRSVNLPFLEGTRLCDCLAEATGCAVRLFTDAEAATWGEWRAAVPDVRRFAHLRIGTGVALGIVAEGQLLRLDEDRTTHLDALVVDRSNAARPCRCGLRGCLETMVSGPALLDRANVAGIEDGLVELNRRAARGEPDATALVDEAARAVVRALGAIVERWRPEEVRLGGGVVERLPIMLDRVCAAWRAMRESSGDRVAEATAEIGSERTAAAPPLGVRIAPPRCGDEAGCIGAALFAHDVPSAESDTD